MADASVIQKIAGPYEFTATGVLGEKRSTMLESELQLKPRMALARTRGYVCYPGPYYCYGLPYPPKTESVAQAMQGWPGLKECEELKQRKKKKKRERDFMALNRGALDKGLATRPEYKSYRSMYDQCKKPPKSDENRRAPLIFPPGMSFGMPTRPSTPIFELMEHRFQKCWIQQRLLSYATEQKHHRHTVPTDAYKETRTSRLRKFTEPTDPRPLWHMPRFSRHAQPHLDTFCTAKDKKEAFDSSKLDSVPRKGQFEVHRQGVYEPAKE